MGGQIAVKKEEGNVASQRGLFWIMMASEVCCFCLVDSTLLIQFKAAVFMPYESDDEPDEYIPHPLDLPNGPSLRFAAFEQSWNKCLARIHVKHIFHSV